MDIMNEESVWMVLTGIEALKYDVRIDYITKWIEGRK